MPVLRCQPGEGECPPRIGLLLPSTNTVMEPDFRRGAPPGWEIEVERMRLAEVSAQAEAVMLDEESRPAAQRMALHRPGVVVFGCTSAGALRGRVFEEALLRELSDLAGSPVIGVLGAVVRCLRRRKSRTLALATPYLDELNGPIRSGLEAAGFFVLRAVGMGIVDNERIAAVSPDAILDLAERAVSGLKLDALFLSCTNLPAMSVLPRLRTRFPFLVVTSNQASLEEAIRTIEGPPAD